MARSLVVFALLPLMACLDEGERHLASAKALHRQLISAGELPDSPKFDAVLAELAQVAPSSPAHERAQTFAAALTAARIHVARPLAVHHSDETSLPPQLAEQTRVCERLAEFIARDGGATDAGLAALADCQKSVDRLAHWLHDQEQP